MSRRKEDLMESLILPLLYRGPPASIEKTCFFNWLAFVLKTETFSKSWKNVLPDKCILNSW